jgi:hypothetical protein
MNTRRKAPLKVLLMSFGRLRHVHVAAQSPEKQGDNHLARTIPFFGLDMFIWVSSGMLSVTLP